MFRLASASACLFQSTLPIREETSRSNHARRSKAFQSTLPIREETLACPGIPWRRRNFNPLFPYGKRLPDPGTGSPAGGISIHSSHTGRDTHNAILFLTFFQFQSTLPIREETGGLIRPVDPVHISIHSSHTGRDPRQRAARPGEKEFQSTLPIREETQ